MKMGILGAGRIANTMAATICRMPQVEPWAVAARDAARAAQFAQTYGFARSYGSYEELAADPEVDLIYIATPHSHHYEHARLCILHGKNVLCEKAFTQNATQARQLLALAKERGVFITEAIWTRYMPIRRIVDRLVAEGAIGTVQSVYAPVVCPLTDKARILDPALAGGALLDMGIYGINFACMVLGDRIRDVQAAAVLSDRGVDLAVNLTLLYEGGQMAVTLSDVRAAGANDAVVYGDKGFLVLENITNGRAVRVYDQARRLTGEYFPPEQISGYEYEVEACLRALAEGRTECPEMPHSETLFIMECMDRIRRQIGVIYPGETL